MQTSIIDKSLDVAHYNITETRSKFFDKNYGGLYLAPAENFNEIKQKTLSHIIKLNKVQPFGDMQPEFTEFFPGELFVEKELNDIKQAELYTMIPAQLF